MNREPKTPIDWLQYWFEVMLFSAVLSLIGIIGIHIWEYYCGTGNDIP